MLDPGRGRTKTGYLWCYAVDDRPWCGPTHPAVAYIYTTDRKNARPAEHLAHFSGVLQVDGYDGFKRLAEGRLDGNVRLAFCWAHMRRGFYEFYTSTKSPLAARGVDAGSPRSMRSRPKSAANPPNTASRCDRREVDRSSRPCLRGCTIMSSGCPERRIWRRPSATRSAIGPA